MDAILRKMTIFSPKMKICPEADRHEATKLSLFSRKDYLGATAILQKQLVAMAEALKWAKGDASLYEKNCGIFLKQRQALEKEVAELKQKNWDLEREKTEFIIQGSKKSSEMHAVVFENMSLKDEVRNLKAQVQANTRLLREKAEMTENLAGEVSVRDAMLEEANEELAIVKAELAKHNGGKIFQMKREIPAFVEDDDHLLPEEL